MKDQWTPERDPTPLVKREGDQRPAWGARDSQHARLNFSQSNLIQLTNDAGGRPQWIEANAVTTTEDSPKGDLTAWEARTVTVPLFGTRVTHSTRV